MIDIRVHDQLRYGARDVLSHTLIRLSKSLRVLRVHQIDFAVFSIAASKVVPTGVEQLLLSRGRTQENSWHLIAEAQVFELVNQNQRIVPPSYKKNSVYAESLQLLCREEAQAR